MVKRYPTWDELKAFAENFEGEPLDEDAEIAAAFFPAWFELMGFARCYFFCRTNKGWMRCRQCHYYSNCPVLTNKESAGRRHFYCPHFMPEGGW